MKQKNTNKITPKIEVPLDSSLGHLAYGDITFVAWREKKLIYKKKIDKNG